MQGRCAAAAAAGLIVAVSAVTTVARLMTPSDGTVVPSWAQSFSDAGVEIDAVSDGPLVSGDIIRSIETHDLQSWPLRDLPAGSSDVVAYEIVRDGARRTIDVTIEPHPVVAIAFDNWGILVFTTIFLGVALFLFRRRPTEPATGALLVLTTALLGSSIAESLGISALDVSGGPMVWLYALTAELIYTCAWAAMISFILVFPGPHPWTIRWPRLVGAAYLVPPLAVVTLALLAAPIAPGFPHWLAWLTTEQAVVTLLCIVAGSGTAVSRWRSATDPVEVQQLRWIVGTGIVSMTAALAGWFIPGLFTAESLLPNEAMGFAGVPVVVGFAVAVLRYRLFDLDVVLNRTLLYAGLTVAVAGLYGSVIALVAAGFDRATEFQGALAASAVVAVAISPIYRVVQLAANRFVYGDRNDPYRALSRLGESLEATMHRGGVLAGVATRIADSLRVPYVAIDLRQGDDLVRVAAAGNPGATEAEFPLMYGGEDVGRLVLARRSPGQPFGSADERLLSDLSRHVGAVAHGELLARELQLSRERLVVAREEERSRIRRELHDGLGPSLSAVALQVEVARRTLRDNPDGAEDELTRARGEAERLVGEIRRLAHNLRPPALDELGLVGALRQQCCSELDDGLAVNVVTQESLDGLPAAVEVAAYRIAVEAVTNVRRHARAKNCQVRLGLNDRLEIEIADDGCGLPASYTPGVGLLSMRERAVELGGTCTIQRRPAGGTCVHAVLPATTT